MKTASANGKEVDRGMPVMNFYGFVALLAR